MHDDTSGERTTNGFLSHVSLLPGKHPSYTWDRLNALLDGIFAIAATVLVLELNIPPNTPAGQLGPQVLRAVLPQYVAYGAGFLLIAGGWLAVRRLAAYTYGVDHYATILLLFTLAVFILTPFSAKVYSAVDNPVDRASAVRLFCVVMIATAILFAVVVRYLDWRGLIKRDLNPVRLRIFKFASYGAWVLPTIALVISYYSHYVAQIVILANLLVNLWPNDAQRYDGQAGVPSD